MTALAVAPHRARDVIGRERLHAGLARALEHGGVAIVAGPGYGKTTLLSEFVTSQGTPYFWCDLADAARPAQPDRGERSPTDALALLERLVDAHPADLDERRLIVIDDLQAVVPGSDLERRVDDLLRRLPPSWRVLVAGRVEPRSPELSRLVQYGSVERLTEDDLTFTPDEVSEFLALDDPGTLSDGRAVEVHALTGGWPAGVALVKRSPRDASCPDAVATTVRLTTYRYFAHSVLSTVPPDLRDFLRRTAVLPFLEPSLCDAALGSRDAAQRIAQLVDQHLFVAPRPERPDVTRYHDLFHAFLLDELRSAVPAAEERELRVRAATQLLQSGRVEDAVEQLIEARDWPRLSDLVRHQAQALIHSGDTATVARWLDRVPADVIADSPWLLLYRGRCLRLRELPGDLRSAQRRAQLLFAREGNADGRAAALFEEAKVAELAREPGEAAALCAEALALVEDPQIRIELLSSSLLYSTMLGRIAEAQAVGREALTLLAQLDHAGTRANDHAVIKDRLGLAYAYCGDFHRALPLLHEACELTGSERVSDRTALLTIFHLAYVQVMQGDFDGALAHLDRADTTAGRLALPVYTRRIRAMRGETLAALGDLAAAEREFRAADWLSDHWVDVGYFYYRSGRHQEAIDFYEAEVGRASAASDPVHRARAQALLGASMIAVGSIGPGEQILRQAATAHRALGFGSRLPGIQLHLADLAFSAGRDEAGKRFLTDALAAARAGGAHNFFALHPAVLHRDLARAQRLDVEPQFVAALRRHWPDLATQAAAKPCAAREGDHHWLVYRDLLGTCPDEQIRDDLARALERGPVTASGLATLRSEQRLTWRELQVFIHYYLPGRDRSDDPHATERRRLDIAGDLGIAEHTIRHHITQIRTKLGLPSQRGLAVYDWAVAHRIVAS